jgi:hypothetical protein
MLATCDEIVAIDDSRTPHHALLTEHARKLALGIRGGRSRAEPPGFADDCLDGKHPVDRCVIQLEGPAGRGHASRLTSRAEATRPKEAVTGCGKASAASKPAPQGAKPKAPKTSKNVPAAQKPAPKKRR